MEEQLSADGTWTIIVKSPMGEQKSTVNLSTNGEALIGDATGPGGKATLTDGKVSGNDVSWKLAVTNPMPMTLEFAGTIAGDTLTGKVKAGNFGSFDFSGSRT